MIQKMIGGLKFLKKGEVALWFIMKARTQFRAIGSSAAGMWLHLSMSENRRSGAKSVHGLRSESQRSPSGLPRRLSARGRQRAGRTSRMSTFMFVICGDDGEIGMKLLKQLMS